VQTINELNSASDQFQLHAQHAMKDAAHQNNLLLTEKQELHQSLTEVRFCHDV
jgi:hypothetical protein